MDNEYFNDQSNPFQKIKNNCGGMHEKSRNKKKFGKVNQDDPFVKGLRGMAIKFYYRFIKLGHSGQEARRMAQEKKIEHKYRRSKGQPRNSNRQCNNSFSCNMMEVNESYPSENSMNKYIGSFSNTNLIPNSTSNSNAHSLAIIPKSYPSQILSYEQLSSLEEAILSEVAKGHTTALAFEGLHFNTGFLVVDCKDTSTALWLKEVAPKLKNCCGMELMACQKEDIPKIYSISLLLPKSNGQTVERTLSLLKAQNTGINTNSWNITLCKDENMGQRMNVDIDEGSRKAIEANGNTLNYRFGKVIVNQLNDKTAEPERNEEKRLSINDGCSESGSSVQNAPIRVKDEYQMKYDQSEETLKFSI